MEKKYASQAEKQRAYRERKRAEVEALRVTAGGGWSLGVDETTLVNGLSHDQAQRLRANLSRQFELRTFWVMADEHAKAAK